MNNYNSFAQNFSQFPPPNDFNYRSQNETFATNPSKISTPGDQIYASRNDDDHRKIFVGGLSWETTENDLREYFQQFGEVTDVSLKVNPATNMSRGFGFVLFGDQSAVDRAVAHPSHILHGRTIDPKRAMAEGSHELSCKVFVGGLDPLMSKDDIVAVFSRYGKVEQIELPYDKLKNERRAFGFITFESEEVADNVCRNYKVMCGNRKVDVKRVYTKDLKPTPDTTSRVRAPISTFPPNRVPFPFPQNRGRGRVDPTVYQTNGMYRSGCPDDGDEFSALQEAFNMIAATASEFNMQSWGGRGYGVPRFQGSRAFRNSKLENTTGRGGAPKPQGVSGGQGRGASLRGGVPGRGGIGGNDSGETTTGFHPYKR